MSTWSDQQWAFVLDLIKLWSFARDRGDVIITLGESWRPDITAWIYALPGKAKIRAVLEDGSIREFPTLVDVMGILHSAHCDRMAVDLNFFWKSGHVPFKGRADHLTFGEFWTGLSPVNVWGGNFKTGNLDSSGLPVLGKDCPHFERQFVKE